VVAADSLLVVATTVVQAANDRQQLAPMLAKLAALPDELGEVETMLADNGYFSGANVAACEAAEIEPVIAMGRQPHDPPLAERCAEPPLWWPARTRTRSSVLRSRRCWTARSRANCGSPTVTSAPARCCGLGRTQAPASSCASTPATTPALPD
jgi:hypothetical protein